MLMIKSNGGSGTVSNCQFNNFIGHSNAYSLDIDSYWSSMHPIAGDGVTLRVLRSRIGKERAPMVLNVDLSKSYAHLENPAPT